MEGKITLITPPDFFENESLSLLLVNLNPEDQEAVSVWLSKNPIKQNVNIYFYMGEQNLEWLFYSFSRCEYKFIDIDADNLITKSLTGYLLGKKNTFYKTQDNNLSAIYQYINSNKITNIELFLEKVFNDQIND